MNINLTAQLKKYDEFIELYKSGDEKKQYNGKSLLFYSLANNAPDERYNISMFLLEKGTDACGVNECGENLFHVLLSRVTHNLQQTVELCEKLIEKKVNVNEIDDKGRVPLQYIINMKYTDDELAPLYKLWFSQKGLILDHKNDWGKTPIELIEAIPYRNKLLEIVKHYY